MRNTPWFQQRRSESAPPAERAKEPPAITQKEQNEMVSRISRPTESARYRQSLFWKLDGFMDKGFHSWSKMELFEDSKQCMWTPNGTIKASCKIRPLNTVLPPLKSGGREVASSVECNGRDTCRASIEPPTPGYINTGRFDRCESRRVVLRPRPSMTRSQTDLITRSSRQTLHPNVGRSLHLHNVRNGGAVFNSKIPVNFGSSSSHGGGVLANLAVPRLNSQSTPGNHLAGC